MITNLDPMMALIFASHERSQIALEDLSSLADDQKAANSLLKEIRGLENELRKARSSGGGVDAAEIAVLENKVAELAKKGVNIDAATFLQTLREAAGGGSAADTDAGSKSTLESLKSAIDDAKENVKAEVSNRELDMQRVTQEVSSATQLQSTLSKRWSDVGNTVIGNMRA